MWSGYMNGMVQEDHNPYTIACHAPNSPVLNFLLVSQKVLTVGGIKVIAHGSSFHLLW